MNARTHFKIMQGMNYPKQMGFEMSSGRERGQITVWLLGMVPFLVVLLALVVNILSLVDAKVTMQQAIDRGVYAGSAHLAHVMNEIAKRNWQFRKLYLDIAKTFGGDSQDDYDWIKKQIEELKKKYGYLFDEMERLISEAYREAHDIAEEIVVKNLAETKTLAEITYQPLYGMPGKPMFVMGDEWDAEIGDYENKDELEAIEIEGPSYDPEDWKAWRKIVRMYLIKSDDTAALAAGVWARFSPPLMKSFFDHENGGFELVAIAAAQPKRGSIKQFSFMEAEDVGEVFETNEGKQFLYHPGFIPIRAVLPNVDVEH